MRMSNWLSKLLASVVVIAFTMGLAGCGSGGGLFGRNGGCDSCGGCDNCGGGGGGWDNGGGLMPWSPGGGSSDPDPTLNLGSTNGNGWGATGQNPPDFSPLAPTSTPMNFDSDTQSVLTKYNARIVGQSVTPERVARVTRALQLYKGRNHPITFDITKDDSKLPMSALWVRRGNYTTVYYYQPDLQHTIDHEVAHDMTLMAMQQEGYRFWQTIQPRWGHKNTWPTSYAQSNEDEARAEILSFLAEAWAGVRTDERPWRTFAPAREIQEAAKVFCSDAVLRGIQN